MLVLELHPRPTLPLRDLHRVLTGEERVDQTAPRVEIAASVRPAAGPKALRGSEAARKALGWKEALPRIAAVRLAEQRTLLVEHHVGADVVDALQRVDHDRGWRQPEQQQPFLVRLVGELQQLGEHRQDRRQRQDLIEPLRQEDAVRPGEDDDRLAVEAGRAVDREAERIARLVQLDEVDRLGPEVAVPVAEDGAHLGAGEGAALGDVVGPVEHGVANGAQEDVEPFLLVGFADALGGEVEVVEDLLCGVEAGPRRLADDAGDDVAAGLLLGTGAFQTFADLQAACSRGMDAVFTRLL